MKNEKPTKSPMISSKAAKFNKQMMGGMAIFAVLLLGCVFGMLYYSFRNVEDKRVIKNLYSVRFDKGMTDSVEVAVNDSVLFKGIASDTLFLSANGNPSQNMISVSDITTGETCNENLAVEPTMVVVSRKDKLKIKATKVMAPVE